MIVATPSGRRTEKESVTVCLKTSCEKKVNMDVLRASLNVCDSLMTFSSFTCVFYSHFLGIPSYNNTYKYTQKVKTLTRFQSNARVTFLWYSNTCGDAWRKCLYATALTKKQRNITWSRLFTRTYRNAYLKGSNSLETSYHHHLSLKREGRWGTTDDFATSFLHFALFSTALWDLPNSRPVPSLMSSSHLFPCLPCILPPFTVPCKMVFARPDERKT